MTVRSSEARRRRREQTVRASVDGIMRDTRFDRVRGLWVRRALVVGCGLVLVSLLPAYLAWGAVGGTAVMVLGIGLLTLLRMGTRILADAPPELLDERQRALQGRAYLVAYRVVGSVAALAALAAFGVVLLSDDPDAYALVVDMDVVTGLAVTVLGLLVAAPTCVVAWEQERV